MMHAFFAWLDQRTGYRRALDDALYENIPGGSRWRYVTGSMLVFAFVTQMVTGLFLWAGYSASAQTAWESVYYIQYEVQGGWLLRGVHHFMAQAMVVLLPIHMLQVILDRAYKAPREVNYWLGLVLMLIVLALGLTGYLLPWDQKGYWATTVATNLMSLAPGGEYQQKLAVGGSYYGNYTLTRFFALHAGFLPLALMVVLAAHVALFRKHGITAHSSPKRADEYFWPQQVLKDGVACLLLLVVVLLACVHFDIQGVITGTLPVDPRAAELGAPAAPTTTYAAARPYSYLLFACQLLKKFKSEFMGAIVVPSLVMLFLFLLPLIARIPYGHVVNVVVFLALLITAGYLTVEARNADYYAVGMEKPPEDPKALEKYEASKNYLEAVEQGEAEARRMRELIAYYGIPREGAAALRDRDSEIQGPRLFIAKCKSCHSHADAEGHGIVAQEPSAPNLYGIGTREWFAAFLDPEKIVSPHVFGKTSHSKGDMVDYVTDRLEDEIEAEQIQAMLAALAAGADVPSERAEIAKAKAAGIVEQGMTVIADNCTECHTYGDEEVGAAPLLTGHGTQKWLEDFIANPAHTEFYGKTNDRMPAFHAKPEGDPANELTAEQITLLARWLRGDDRTLSPPPEVDQAPEAE